jgi:hypothetical protein
MNEPNLSASPKQVDESKAPEKPLGIFEEWEKVELEAIEETWGKRLLNVKGTGPNRRVEIEVDRD